MEKMIYLTLQLYDSITILPFSLLHSTPNFSLPTDLPIAELTIAGILSIQ